jgi:hypothetical protein
MTTIDNKILPKFCSRFYCENCDYNTDKKSSYETHIESKRHKNNALGIKNNAKFCSKIYSCELCEKKFNDRAGLWRHKKKCVNQETHINNSSERENISDKDLIAMLIKDNSEFKSMMMEIIKNGTHNTTSNSHNSHSNNKTFNLNFFLNEQCKDALNMDDFVSSIKVELCDVEHTGRMGFVEGISKLLLKNLRALDQTKRPIHCSDLKRETLYIKTNNKWEKEDDEKQRLKKAIKEVAYENIKKITDWTKANPGCSDIDSRKNDLYLKIVSNSMSGGSVEETQKNLDNIVRNIAKEVTIDKENK